eukprot:2992580-Pleurochrysis_carterae.AAC.2
MSNLVFPPTIHKVVQQDFGLGVHGSISQVLPAGMISAAAWPPAREAQRSRPPARVAAAAAQAIPGLSPLRGRRSLNGDTSAI